MPYVVDPTNPASPANSDGATQGAEEFRALKQYIQDLFKGQWLAFSVSDQINALTTGTKLTVRLPACTVLAIRGSLQVASSLGIPTFDVDKNGASILSTLLTIDVGETTSVTAAVPAVIGTPTIADDDEITFEIDVAGTGAIGAIVYLKVKWT